MADYSELKAAIRAAIYDNTEQAITGEVLQDILVEMVDALGVPAGGIPASELTQAVQQALEKALSAYQKPQGGIPASDIASGVIPDVSQFITKAVTDLVHYYTKEETYTQQQVNDLIGAISQFHYEIYASLGDITSPASNVLYLIGPTGSGSDQYEEYVYANGAFTKIGDTSIDLSGYLRYTPQTLTEEEKAQARQNIGAAAEGSSSEVAESALSVLALEALEAYYTFRRTAGGAKIGKGLGRIAEVRGKSLVWNQLFSKGGNYTLNGITLTFDGETGTYTLNGTATRNFTIYMTSAQGYCTAIPAGHNCLVKKKHIGGTFSGNGQSNIHLSGYDPSYLRFGTDDLSSAISSYSNDTRYPLINIYEGDVFTSYSFTLQAINLTLMFAGNEPTTVAEFEAMFPLPYYAYNAGEIISNKTEAVEVVGRNQWDEEWEGGTITTDTGTNTPNGTRIRSKNFCRAFPNMAYFCKGNMRMFLYDANYNYLGYRDRNNLTVTTPAYTAYFKISLFDTTTYNHDICINISDPSFNGQYEQYKKNTIELNLPTLTGKLNGEGESVVVFPEGLKSVRDVFDGAIGKIGTKRIFRIVFDGTETFWSYTNSVFRTGNIFNTYPAPRIKTMYGTAMRGNGNSNLFGLTTPGSGIASAGTWDITDATNWGITFNRELVPSLASSTDVADWKAWLAAQYASGNPLIVEYELAEPLVYELDESIEKTFEVEAGGTERRIPEDTATVVNAPFYGTVEYPIALQPKDTISNDSLTALLTALKSAGKIANYTMTWDAATNSYKFTIS